MMILDVVALHVRLLLTLTHAEPEASSYPTPAAAAVAGVVPGRGVSARALIRGGAGGGGGGGGYLFNSTGAHSGGGAFDGMGGDGSGTGGGLHEGPGRADERAVLALVAGALMRKVLQAAGGWTPLATPLGLIPPSHPTLLSNPHDHQLQGYSDGPMGQKMGWQGDKGQGKTSPPPPLLRLEVQ